MSINYTIRAVISARVSSKEQAEKKFSIPEIQLPACKALIKEKGWSLVNIYIDEGCDGNTFLKRPGLQKMLTEDIDTYDVVVVYSFDRLVRDNASTEAKIYEILDSRGKQATSALQRIEIVNPREYDPKSLNVATHRRFRGIEVTFDSLIRRTRFMASKKALVIKGKPISEAQYGYKMIREVDPKNERRTIGYRIQNKKETSILKRIFEERVYEGKSNRQIAMGLNQDGIKARKGGEWSGARISQVLRNPFPSGYFYWHKTEDRKYGDTSTKKIIPKKEWKLVKIDKKQEKYYRKIISEDLFDRAQKITNANTQTRGKAVEGSNILAGIIKCPECGAPMVETSMYKIKQYPYIKGYFQCSRWHNQRMCCPQKYPSWPIKELIKKRTKTFLDDPKTCREYLKERRGAKGTIEQNKTELRKSKKELEKARENIKSLNWKYAKGKIKDKYYQSLLQELEKEEEQWEKICTSLREIIQEDYQKKDKEESLKALSKEIRGRFKSLSPSQTKLILKVLIDKVIPGKTLQGKGTKGNPRKNNPIIIWNNPAIMEQECTL